MSDTKLPCILTLFGEYLPMRNSSGVVSRSSMECSSRSILQLQHWGVQACFQHPKPSEGTGSPNEYLTFEILNDNGFIKSNMGFDEKKENPDCITKQDVGKVNMSLKDFFEIVFFIKPTDEEYKPCTNNCQVWVQKFVYQVAEKCGSATLKEDFDRKFPDFEQRVGKLFAKAVDQAYKAGNLS